MRRSTINHQCHTTSLISYWVGRILLSILGWKVEGLVQGANGVHEVSFASEEGVARQVRVDGKPAPQVALGQIARVIWLIPAMDRLWIEGAEGRRRFLDRMALSFFPDHAQAALDYEKAMRDRNRLLKDQVRDAHWYGALEAQMARTGAVLHANRGAALELLGGHPDAGHHVRQREHHDVGVGGGEGHGDRGQAEEQPRAGAHGRVMVADVSYCSKVIV